MVVPLVIPAIFSVAAFAFLDSWNSLLFPLALMSGDADTTLSPGMLVLFGSLYRLDWGGMMAAAAVTALPVVVIFLVLQR